MRNVKRDHDNPLGLHEQVAGEIRRAIADGETKSGERLPPAKDLAAVLGAPATSYVADFVGADRGLKRLSVTPIEEGDLEQPPVVHLDDPLPKELEARWAVVLGGLLSGAIELAQIWIPGRDSSLGDVLSNTLGAALGVALLATARVWLLPSRRAARWLAGGWTLAAALTAWATVLLVRPSYPPSVYYGQWTHDLGYLAWYRGRVLSAQVGTLPVPDGRAVDSRALRTRRQQDDPIVLQATAGPPVRRAGELCGIMDDHQRGMVAL